MTQFLALPLCADAGSRLQEELNALGPGSVLVVDRHSGHCEALPAEELTRLVFVGHPDTNRILVFHMGGGLKLRAPVRCGFRLNWVAEAAPGKLETHPGILTGPELEADLEVAVGGSLLGAL